MIIRRASGIVTLVIITVFALTAPAFAAPQLASSTDLIEHAAAFDGQEIIYTGEAIGDIMVRGNYAWVNVFDGANAVGLWLSAQQASRITALGSYKSTGDKVVVTGTFHRACAEHGGDFDIHVTHISVVEPGAPTEHRVATVRLILAVLLTALAAALFVADRNRGRLAGDGQRKA